MLTIAIPTYNRNEILKTNLPHLLEQITPDVASQCRILVLDNASPASVEATLRPLIEEYSHIQIEVRRNKVNVGANANIMRCFEECETPWLWVLSDDDTPKPDALTLIFAHLQQYPDAIFFNFSVEHHQPRSQTFLTRGPLEFVRRIESFGNSIFISTNIYRADLVRQNLRLGHHYSYTAAPQFIIVLKSMSDESMCCSSSSTIVTHNPPPVGEQWSLITFALGNRTILELPLEPEVRTALAHSLLRFEVAHAPLKRLVYRLLLLVNKEGDRQGALFLYDQICARRYWGKKSLKKRLQLFVFRLLLVFPGLGYHVVSRIYRSAMGVEGGQHRLEDRSNRL